MILTMISCGVRRGDSQFMMSREVEPVSRSFCRRRSCTFTEVARLVPPEIMKMIVVIMIVVLILLLLLLLLLPRLPPPDEACILEAGVLGPSAPVLQSATSTNTYIYIYTCMYVCVHIYIYIYIYNIVSSPAPPRRPSGPPFLYV